MKTFKIVVPAGIGDFSWLWSKFSTISDAKWEVYVPDSYPQRTKQFVDLLPNAKGLLGIQSYRDIIVWGNAKGASTWEQTVRNFGENEFIYIQCNEHLGQGRRLEEWMPDLKTDFHYKFNFDVNNGRYFSGLLYTGPLMGIHMASIKGIRAWKAWMPEYWNAFLHLVHKDFPDVTFVLLGGTWDIDTASEVIGLAGEDFPIRDLTGKTSVSDVIKILNEIDYYVGYSSGLGVLANVLGKPSTTLWPVHQAELIYSWPDPVTVADRNYMGFVYDAPERIYNRIKPKLKEVYYGSQGRFVANSGQEKVR